MSAMLWPSLGEMTHYLKGWAEYAERVEGESRRDREALAATQAELDELKKRWEQAVSDVRETYVGRVKDLEGQVERLESQMKNLTDERTQVVKTICSALEIAATPNMTLQTAASNAITMVEQSKQMIRRNL